MSFFNENYGEGALEGLLNSLKFNGIKPTASRDMDIRIAETVVQDQPALGEIFLDWESGSYSASIQIVYSASYWLFVSLTSKNPNSGEPAQQSDLLGFLCYELSNFAKDNTDVTKFICTAANEQNKLMFLKSGFEDKGGNMILEAELYEWKPPTSKLEDYGNWCHSGKNPELEPSWRKEIN